MIEQEKGHQKFVQGIENFDTSNLKHAETMEKNPLPTKEGMAPLSLVKIPLLDYDICFRLS